MKPASVFLSYRREHSPWLARVIHDGLRERGHDVFMDVEGLAAGNFEDRLLREIE